MTGKIRKATIDDSTVILTLITELAAYEQLSNAAVGTVEQIEKTLFCNSPKAEAIIIEENGETVGMALFFHNYSTFLCRHGIYIEDLFVREQFRGKGYGKALLKHICQLAIERDCGRVEWWCLDWNKPSIDFYLSLNAEPMTDWTVYRLNRNEIVAMVRPEG